MDYDARLSRLRTAVNDADKAAEEIDSMLSQICESSRILKLFSPVDDSVTYLPLEHSKHKEFIECLTMISDIAKNVYRNVPAFESTSSNQIKSSIQHEETVCQKNQQIVQTLESLIVELRSSSLKMNFTNKTQNEETQI